MKIVLVILAAGLALFLAMVFARSRPSTHLDVTPDARERIEKAKRQ